MTVGSPNYIGEVAGNGKVKLKRIRVIIAETWLTSVQSAETCVVDVSVVGC